MELTRAEIRQLALARARAEHPAAKDQVAEMYEVRRWQRYWVSNTYNGVTNHQQARAVNSVERGS